MKLKLVLLGIMLFLNFSLTSASLLEVTGIISKEGVFTLDSVEVNLIRNEEDISNIQLGEEAIEISLFDSEENKLYTRTETISFYILSDPPTEVNEAVVYLELPFYETMEIFVIRYKGNEIAKIHLKDHLPEVEEVPKEINKDCFIATTVYKDINADEVETLRQFRDNVLIKNKFGKEFVDFYYSGAGEKTAEFIQDKIPFTIPIIKKELDKVVKTYNLFY